MKPTILWGAKGHAKVLRECLAHLGHEVVAVFDNDAGIASPFADVPIHHGKEGFADWLRNRTDEPVCGLVAIGGSRGSDRVELQEHLKANNVLPFTAVHPAAFVAASARLGEGCQLLARAVVCVDAELGPACIVNTAASVDHDCRLGAGVHVAPGATLTGEATVEDFVLIGAGAVVLPRVRIGSGSVVGAGAVVTSDLPPNCVAFGNPARIVRNLPTG